MMLKTMEEAPMLNARARIAIKGEAARFAEGANCVAEVEEEVLKVGFPAGVADFFFDALEAAEFEICAAARLFRADSRGYVAGGLLLEMELEFSLKFFVCAGFVQGAAKPAHGYDSFSGRGGPGRRHRKGAPS